VGKYLRYLLFFGPGAVLASMTIGQGQLILGPQIGAWAGFSLLWLITLNLGSYVIAYIGCRFTMITGISTMDLFAKRTRYGWLNWLFIGIILIFVPLFTAAIITTLGESLRWIVGFGHYLFWGILFGVLAGVLVLVGRYRLVEHTQAFFVAVLGIGALLSVAVLKLDIIDVVSNFFFIGHVPHYPSWVDVHFPSVAETPVPLLMLGYLGTLTISLVPLVGYLGWIKVKKWGIFKDCDDPDNLSQSLFRRFEKEGKISYLSPSKGEIKKSRLLLKPLLIDLGIAFFVVSIVSAAYMIAGASLLGPQGDGTFKLPTDVNLIREQAVIFSHVASWLHPVYQVSVVFALFGTAYAGFEAVSRMLYETAKNVSRKIVGVPYQKFLFFVFLYILATGIPLAILGALGVSIILMLSLTLLFIGVVGVLIYGVGVLVLSQTLLPQGYKLGKGLLFIAGIALAFLSLPFVFLII
jgi:Mn2+/Fe2+ NRAMP family transporter